MAITKRAFALYLLLMALCLLPCVHSEVNEWQLLDPAGSPTVPPARSGSTLVVDEAGVSYLYGAGSIASTDVWMLNITNLAWELLPVAPDPKPAASRHHISFWINNELHTACFSNTDRRTYRYSPATNTWTGVDRFPSLIDSASVSVIGEIAYVYGGKARTLDGAVRDRLYKYTYAQDIWDEILPATLEETWPPPVYGHSSVVYNENLYIFGGLNGDTTFPSNDMWRYDIASVSWTKVIPSSTTRPPVRYRHNAVLANNKMIVFGGFNTSVVPTNKIQVYYNDLWQFNFATNTWSELKPIGTNFPSRRQGMTSVVWDTFVYVHGGQDRNSNELADIWGYQFAKQGPKIISLVANDPDDMDVIYGNGDTITVKFDQPTNTPSVSTTARVNSLLDFSQALGQQYTGQWTDSSTLRITIVSATGAAPPAIGVLTVSTRPSGGLLSVDLLSFNSDSTSQAITGDWGVLVGPAITGFAASDPDNKDAIFSNGDVLTITFGQATSRPPLSSTQLVNNVFAFSRGLGTAYLGSWNPTGTVATITITDATGNQDPKIGSLTVTVKASGNLRNAAQDSDVSRSSSQAITGNWGTLPGPTISSFVANDPDDLDAIFSKDDTVDIVFSEPTSRPAVAVRTDVDLVFSFSTLIGTDYTGSWVDDTRVRIRIVEASVPTPPKIGQLRVTVKAGGLLTNKAQTSLPSVAQSPVLTGDWGLLAGPAISSLVANDPDDGDALFSSGDTIKVTFNRATNVPGAGNKTEIDAIFQFDAPGIGDDYAGAWSTDGRVLTITVVSAGAKPWPAIGVFRLQVRNGVLMNRAGTSLFSTSRSQPITGDWGLLAGPQIVSFLANDPDDLDAIYSDEDSLLIGFDIATNQPNVLDKAAILSVFTFSADLGTAINGTWITPQELLIYTKDTSGHNNPEIGKLVVSVTGTLQNALETSLVSRSVSDPVTGDWGLLAGPAITAFVANDPDDLDSVYSNDDTVTLTFAESTNRPPVGSTQLLNDLLDFPVGVAFGAAYSGTWDTPSTLRITITDTSGNSNVEIGSLTISLKPGGNVRNSALTSLPSEATTPQLSGDWGRLEGPNITQILAADPNNGDASYSDGDTITIQFDEATNQPDVSTKDDLDALLSFQVPLGTDYTGVWRAATVLQITIVDSRDINTGNKLTSPPKIGVFFLTVIGSLKNAPATSLDSIAVSPPITGDWGRKGGPFIVSANAADPDNLDAIYSNQDTITFVFNEPTNRAVALTNKASIDNAFTFSEALGTAYSGTWLADDQFRITIVNNAGHNNPEIGKWTMTIKSSANLRAKGDTSLPSESTSPSLTGNWGNLPGPDIESLIANDPDDQDAVYSDGDTITIVFAVPPQQPDVSSKTLTDQWFSFSQNLGADYSGAWTAATQLRITVTNTTGATPPVIGQLTVRVTGQLLNAAGTSVASKAQSPPITGDWGLLAGPQIVDFFADDPDDQDAVFSDGDVLVLIFGTDTNQPPVSDPSALGKQVSFSSDIGPDHSARWVNPRRLEIVIIDSNSPNKPVLSVTFARLIGNITNAQGTSLTSTSTSPVLGGDFGLKLPPYVVNITANDPDDRDGKYSQGDTIDVLWSEDTNQPPVATKTQLDNLFQFAPQQIGLDYTGTWVSPGLLRITITSAIACSTNDPKGPCDDPAPQIGQVRFTVKKNIINNAANDALFNWNSPPYQAVSSPLGGDWGNGPPCQATTCSGCLANEQGFCGWCASTQTCYEGDNAGPLAPNNCPAAWVRGSCPDCNHPSKNCVSCSANSLCGWCRSDQTCREGSTGGMYESGTCNEWLYQTCPVVILGAVSGDTAEWGQNANFTVRLSMAPRTNENVVLSVRASKPSEVAVTSSVLFTSTSWNDDQLINLQGRDDFIDDGDQQYTVTVGSPITADEKTFEGISATTPNVLNLDDDTAGITVITPQQTQTSEAAGPLKNFVFQVVLDSEPLNPVTISLSSSDITEGVPDLTSLTFTGPTWSQQRTVTVVGQDDFIDDNDVPYQINFDPTQSTDPLYDNKAISSIALTNLDDDKASLTFGRVTPNDVNTTEDGTSRVARVYVELGSQPSVGDVVVRCVVSDADEARADPPALTFTQTSWQQRQTCTIIGVDDNKVDPLKETPYQVSVRSNPAADPSYSQKDGTTNNGLSTSLDMVNIDDDVAGFELGTVSGDTSEAGGTATFTVALATQPLAPVTVDISVDDTAEATLVSATPFVFSSATWSNAQTVTVRGVDDLVADPLQRTPFNVRLAPVRSSDPVYNGFIVSNVQVYNQDNDKAGFRVIPNNLTLSEDDVIDNKFTTVYVSLTSQPTANMSVALTSSNSNQARITNSNMLYFSPLNWNENQTFTMQGVDDTNFDPNAPFSVGASVVSADTKYAGFSTIANGIVIDNDTPGLVVLPAYDNGQSVLYTYEDGRRNATMRVRLSTLPLTTVTMNLVTSDNTEGYAVPAQVVFTSTNGKQFQDIVIAGRDDFIDDGDISYTITATTSSTDPGYQGLSASPVPCVNIDNDVARIVATPPLGQITETGGSATFTVYLGSQPTASVTAGVASLDETEGVVTPSVVSFSTSTWSTPQTVTVTGVDDVIRDKNVGFIIRVGPANSSDSLYHQAIADVDAINIDDDLALFKADPVTGWTTESGSSTILTYRLSSQPSADVTVSVSTTDETQATVSPSSFTFTSSTWSNSQTVTVKGSDDLCDDRGRTVDIQLGPAVSSDANFVDAPNLLVPIINLDNGDRVGIEARDSRGAFEATTLREANSEVVVIFVKLTSQPKSAVTLPLRTHPPGQVTVNPASLVFSKLNWNIQQNITIQAIDDLLIDNTVAVDFLIGPAVSDDCIYKDVFHGPTVITVIDDESASIIVSHPRMEGQPVVQQQLQQHRLLQASMSSVRSVMISHPYLLQSNTSANATATSTPRTNTTATPTPSANATTPTPTPTPTPVPTTNTSVPATGTLTDLPPDATFEPITWQPSPFATDHYGIVREGQSEGYPYAVRLGSAPSTTVTVAVNVDPSSAGTASTTSLTFTSIDWRTSQAVLLIPTDENIPASSQSQRLLTDNSSSRSRSSRIEPSRVSSGISSLVPQSPPWRLMQSTDTVGILPVLVTFGPSVSGDPNYNGLSAVTSPALKLRRSTANYQVSQIQPGGFTFEDQTLPVSFFFVTLTRPLASGNTGVTFRITSSDISEGIPLVDTITIPASNWSRIHRVRVRGVDDFVYDGNVPYKFIVTPTTQAGSLWPTLTVNAKNVDNDKLALLIRDPPQALVTNEAGSSVEFIVSLTTLPQSSVVVPIASSDTSEGRPSPLGLTFTAQDWNVERTVSVVGQRDDIEGDGARPYVITFGPTVSSDTRFVNINDSRNLINTDVLWPTLTSVSPSIVPLSGGVTTYLTGTGLVDGFVVYIGDTLVVSNTSRVGTTVIIIASLPAGRQIGYASVRVVNADGGYAILRNQLYYAPDNCARVGYAIIDGVCRECQTVGAICPGGDRIWPLPGYWRENGTSNIFKCHHLDRCPGGEDSRCNPGYEGDICGRCSDNYYMHGDLCHSCGSDGSLFWSRMILMIVFIVLFILVTSLIAPHALVYVAWAFIAFQLLVVVGVTVPPRVPDFLRSTFSLLSIIAFDVGSVLPGCEFPGRYEVVFWVNIITCIVVLILCFAVTPILKTKLLGDKEAYWNRVLRSALLACILFYITVFRRALEGLHCSRELDRNVLEVQRSEECYSDTDVYITSWTLLMTFCSLLPLIFVAYLVVRLASGIPPEPAVQLRVGFLYKSCRHHAGGRFFFAVFACAMALTAISAVLLKREYAIHFVVTENCLLILFAISVVMRPFKSHWKNFALSFTLFTCLFAEVNNFIASPMFVDSVGNTSIWVLSIIAFILTITSIILWIIAVAMYLITDKESSYEFDSLPKMSTQPLPDGQLFPLRQDHNTAGFTGQPIQPKPGRPTSPGPHRRHHFPGPAHIIGTAPPSALVADTRPPLPPVSDASIVSRNPLPPLGASVTSSSANTSKPFGLTPLQQARAQRRQRLLGVLNPPEDDGAVIEDNRE